MYSSKQLLKRTWLLREETPQTDWHCDAQECMQADVLPIYINRLFPTCTGAVWFYHRFTAQKVPAPMEQFLEFDRVDYKCDVYLNGIYIGCHMHAEESFSFCVTDAVLDGENLLSLRIFSPCSGSENAEGISLLNIPNGGRSHAYYTYNNRGGILGDVALSCKPPIYLENIQIVPSCSDGHTDVFVSVAGEITQDVSVTAKVYDGNSLLCTKSVPGASLTTIGFVIENPELWSLEKPSLYTLEIIVSSHAGQDCRRERFGFRTFCVQDGYFLLNGKRILLKCAHAGTRLSRETIAQAKAMGFNCIRFLADLSYPDVLDFCDELGMMVYDETAVSWGMQEHEQMPEQMSAYLNNMLIQDRNHPCVTIYGIFNETIANKVFDFAVSYLPEMRKFDCDRVILLSSGRWDNRLDIGSFANPGSDAWEYQWGAEAADNHARARGAGADLVPYRVGMGDNHCYPTVPFSPKISDFLRKMGEDSNPVFLSECGVGSQYTLQECYDKHVRAGLGTLPTAEFFRGQLEKLHEFLEKYDLTALYPTKDDFLMASIEKHAEQRRVSFDVLRANPSLCGYSMTSFGCSHEGVYYADGKYMPGIVETLHDCWAPLKWSLFTEKSCIRAGVPFEIEAVLCNEDVLKPGEYTALLSVTGKNGVVWQKEVPFVYPSVGKSGRPPLAYSVWKETIPGITDNGSYTFSAALIGGPVPTCSKKAFRILCDETDLHYAQVGICHVPENITEYLRCHGVNVYDYTEAQSGLILVGNIPDCADKESILNTLNSKASAGCTVFPLDSSFWEDSASETNTNQGFMEQVKLDGAANSFAGRRIYYRNWLYHLDSYASHSPLFAGILDSGILDMEDFRDVYPCHYMVDTAKPVKTYCAAFGSGLLAPGSCIAGLVLGEFACGEGKYLVNTLRLIENIGSDIVADRILSNIIKLYNNI